MKKNTTIKLKAVFLAIVFALNNIVGFACSMGIGMSSNTSHPKKKDLKTVAANHKQTNNGNNGEGSNCHELKKTGKRERSEGTCCANKVKEFQDIDKALPPSKNIVHLLSVTEVAPIYHHLILLDYTDVVRNIKPFVRSYHPPIPDICTAIQSLRI